MKSLPVIELSFLCLCFVHPQGALNINERTIPQPRLLQLSVEKLSREVAFLMDAGTVHCFKHSYQANRNTKLVSDIWQKL